MPPLPTADAPRERVGQRALTVRDAAIGACATSVVVHAWLALEHRGDAPLRASSFAAAAVALAAIGYALTRPSLTLAPAAAATLFAALLVAYPVVVVGANEHVDALGIATKAVEAVGLVAAVLARRQPRSFGSAAALAGSVVAMLLLSSLGHTH